VSGVVFVCAPVALLPFRMGRPHNERQTQYCGLTDRCNIVLGLGATFVTLHSHFRTFRHLWSHIDMSCVFLLALGSESFAAYRGSDAIDSRNLPTELGMVVWAAVLFLRLLA
jgi:hypothetical protein